MNHQNPGGFQGWGGGHPQQPQVQHPQQHPHAQNNNPQLQQFQQMQQQLLFQQHHNSSQGGHNQMPAGHSMGMGDLPQPQQGNNNHMNFQQQQLSASQPQPQGMHDQGAASQGMMNQNSWMHQAAAAQQQQQQQQQLSAPMAPQNMMTMMGGGGQANIQGGMMTPHSSQQSAQQQQQQQQLYWNVMQSQQQQQPGGNQNFGHMVQQQQQPHQQQQPNQQQHQLQSHLQQMQQMQHPSNAQMQQQMQSHQHQGMMSSGLPQATVGNEGGGMTLSQPHPSMNTQQQQLQQLFSMQQQNAQQGSSNNNASAPAASSNQQQQQLNYQMSQGQQQLQPSQQSHADKSSSSSNQRPNQAQLLLQQQNLISQLQRRIQQQRQHPSQNNNNNNSSTPAPAVGASSTSPAAAASSSSSALNYMGGMMQQQGGLAQLQQQQQQQQQQSSQQQHLQQLQMHHQQNSQQQQGAQGMFGGSMQGQLSQQQPQGNVNANEQQLLLLMAQQQQQQQQQQSQLRPDGLPSATNAVNVASLQQQQFLQQQPQLGFQRQTSNLSASASSQQQQQTMELMMQRQQSLQQQQQQKSQQQELLGNKKTNQQQQHQRDLNQQQQKQLLHDLNSNKPITNDGMSSPFSTQFPSNIDMMNTSISSVASQQPKQKNSSFSSPQLRGMQSSTASTPVTTNHGLDSSKLVMNQSQQQQQQFMMSQMTEGTLNMGGGQVAGNAPSPAGIAANGVGGASSAGGNSNATTGEDSQDEPSLDQRVKQFELMQQQQLSMMRQQQQPVSKSGSTSGGGDGCIGTQPPRSKVDEMLPSRSNSIGPSQPPPQLPPVPQQQPLQPQVLSPQLKPQQQQHTSPVAPAVAAPIEGPSFSINDDSSESPEVPEPRASLAPPRAGSPGSLGVAEPDPIVDGATIIRSEGAINVIAPVRHNSSTGGGDGGNKDESGGHTSSSVGADQGESGSEQPFLDGHFAGGWQSNVDLPDRRQIIFSIIKVIERKRPDTNRMSQNRLPLMAKKLEEHLYRSAHVKDAYIDLASLKKRLHLIAKGVGIPKSNTPSVSSIGTDPSVMFTSSPTGNVTNGIVSTPASVVNLLQPMTATSEASMRSLSDVVESEEPLPQLNKEQLTERAQPRVQDSRQRDKMTDNDDDTDTELDRLNKNLAQATARDSSDDVSSMEIDDDEIAEKKKVILQQQQRRLLLLRHASKCREGLECRVKFCPQMVTLWKHMKTCRDKNCKAPHCLSSRCVLNHYRICKSEGLTSTCGICAPVMNHIRSMKGSPGQQDREVLNQMSSMSDGERYDEMPVDTEAEEQDSSDSFKALKEALVSEGATEPSEEMDVCAQPQPEEKQAGPQVKTKQDLLNQVQQQKVQLTNQNQKLQQQLNGASNPLQLEQFQKQQNILQHLNQQFQQQQVVLESEIQRQGEEKSSIDINEGQQQSPGKNLQSQEGKRSSENMDGGNEDVRPNKVMKRENSSVSASVSVVSESSTTKKSSSLVTSMQKSDIEAHLDSLVNSGRLTPRNISRKCLPMVKKLRDHENGWVFSEPVDPIELGIHDYFDIIEHPMDLDLVTKKLENGVYWDISSFRKDTRLVFENAILYNGKDSDVGMMAVELLDIFDHDFSNIFKGLHDDDETKKSDCCSLCGNYRRLYELPSLFCSGTCGRNIRRNAFYYTDRMKQNQWCEACYVDQKDDEPLLLDNGKETKKSLLHQMKNDKSPEEKWVQCDKCNDWVHQVCALFNGTQNYKSASFTCPKCYVKSESSLTPSLAPKGAVDLLQCKLSESIEKGIEQTLSKEYERLAKERNCAVAQVEKAENLCVRVVSSLDKKQKVREGMKARYSKSNYPSEFPVKSKCILLFQKIHGVDVLLFSMYVYEYGDECPAPNRRRVYISYLDSVRYLTPAQYRTVIYQSVLIEYLRFVKMRGFHTAHIWSCPPAKGDEYIFYCHPVNQLTPRNDMLCAWYNNTLQKAKEEGIALDIRSLYDDYFKDNVVNRRTGEPFDPTSLPYFDGDYVPGEIEKIIKDLDEDDNRREGTKIKDASKSLTAPSKSEGKRAGTRSNPGKLVNQGRDKVMNRLDLILSRMKENFFVVQLLSDDFIDAVEGNAGTTSEGEKSSASDDDSSKSRTIGKNPYILDLAENKDGKTPIPLCEEIIPASTKDEDPIMEQECFETRLQFLNYCQRNNYQFDELRRAKYTSTMVLAYLHNPREEKEQQIKAHLEVIAHAASCDGCVSKNCRRMKQLFCHVRECELTYKRGCKICTRLFMLLIKHARDCPTDGKACPIPFCERIKERNRMLLKQQRLMDDRRRNAQNTRAKEDSA